MPSNPFYVQPAGDYGPGLMGLAQTVGQVGERKKAEQKDQMMREEVSAAIQSKDPNRIQSVMGKYPELATKIKDIIEIKFPGGSGDAYKDALFSVAVDFNQAPQVLENLRAQFAKDGIDPQEQTTLDKFQELLKSDPKTAQANVEAEFAMLADKDMWEKYKDITDKSKGAFTIGKTRYSASGDVIVQGSGDPYEGLEAGYETYLRANNLSNSPENYNKYNKFAVAQKKAAAKDPVERPYVAKLMSEGWVPSTRITGPMLEAYEAAAKRADEMGNPLTPQDLWDMEFKAVQNRATGQTAGGRLTLARKQNIEAANGLLKDLKATSAKLNYSPVKFIAAIEKFKKGQMVDPIFTEYMTQRADSLFILGNALKQNGLTDKSIEVEEEAFSPTLSPEAFNAWYNTQLRALNRAAEEMNRDFKYGIETHPTYPAGQGGAPTAENPTAMTPEQERNVKSMSTEELKKIAGMK